MRLPNLDQARERQAHLEALCQQRETAQAAPAAPALSAPQPTTPPADLQVLIQQAVQQVLAAQAKYLDISSSIKSSGILLGLLHSVANCPLAYPNEL